MQIIYIISNTYDFYSVLFGPVDWTKTDITKGGWKIDS